MKRLVCPLFVFCFFLSLTARAETVTVGFDELAGLVTARNKNVLAGMAFAQGARAKTGHLTRSFLPHIQAQGGSETFKTGNVSSRTEPVGLVEGKINLFRSGQDVLEEKIRDGQKALSQTHLTQRQRGEITRARTLFADALFYREGISGIGNVLGKLGHFSGLVRERIDAGLITEADRLELDFLKSRLRQERALLEEDYEHALNELKVTLGLPLSTKLRLHSPMKKSTAWNPPPVNVQSHHEVVALKEKTTMARLQKKQAARWWAPSLETYGSYGLHAFREREYPDRADRDEAVAGVRLTLNLFDGLQGSSQSRSHDYQAQGYALEAQQRSQELEAQHERLQHELKTRTRLLGQLQANVSRGKRYLEMTLEEYQRGIRTSSELFTALREYLEEQKSLAQTRRDYFHIKSHLMALAGE